jgi:hypothetical protein
LLSNIHVASGLIFDWSVIQHTFPIANNQSTAANIKGIFLDNNKFRTEVIYYDIRRKTDTFTT